MLSCFEMGQYTTVVCGLARHCEITGTHHCDRICALASVLALPPVQVILLRRATSHEEVRQLLQQAKALRINGPNVLEWAEWLRGVHGDKVCGADAAVIQAYSQLRNAVPEVLVATAAHADTEEGAAAIGRAFVQQRPGYAATRFSGVPAADAGPGPAPAEGPDPAATVAPEQAAAGNTDAAHDESASEAESDDDDVGGCMRGLIDMEVQVDTMACPDLLAAVAAAAAAGMRAGEQNAGHDRRDRVSPCVVRPFHPCASPLCACFTTPNPLHLCVVPSPMERYDLDRWCQRSSRQRRHRRRWGWGGSCHWTRGWGASRQRSRDRIRHRHRRRRSRWVHGCSRDRVEVGGGPCERHVGHAAASVAQRSGA